MTNQLKLTLNAAFLLLLFNASVFSQSSLTNELAIIAGPNAFLSDFGERNDFDTNTGNTGFGIGVVHYLNFNDYYKCDCYGNMNFFNNHFKLRSEISMNFIELDHKNSYYARPEKVDPSSPSYSEGSQKLYDHTGQINNINIGTGLEFYPFGIADFQLGYERVSPYMGLGFYATKATPGVSTDYGDGNVNNGDNFFWPDGIKPESTVNFNIALNLGTRIKINRYFDTLIDLKWHGYTSDVIDGLNHDGPSDKSNDWMLWGYFGIVYYL